MRRFDSLPPSQHRSAGKGNNRRSPALPDFTPLPDIVAPQFPFPERQPAPKQPTSQPVTHTPAPPVSSSLLTALQSTIKTEKKKPPLIIPGSRRSVVGRKDTEKLKSAKKGMPWHLRVGWVFACIIAMLLFTHFTLVPLSSGQTPIPLIGDAIAWVESQQWNIIAHMPVIGPNQRKTILPPMNLPKSEYVVIAQQAAIDEGIDPEYFVRQIMSESGFNPNAISPAGAIGIAQFMPATAASLGVNPYDPVDALKGAARYMASISKRYGGDYAKALAAYNAGGGTVDYAIKAGGSNWMNFIPSETRNYIYKVMGI